MWELHARVQEHCTVYTCIHVQWQMEKLCEILDSPVYLKIWIKGEYLNKD